VKVDKTLVASVALHVLVIGWGLVSFSSRAFESVPEDSLPVDIISADQLAKVTAGMRSGAKQNPKPLVEKVAEARPVDDAVGKISDKVVVTDAEPDPVPKPEKPVEKKPDPPKPVVEDKPKEESKPAEKKPEQPKVDPIAEALKKDEAKKPPPKAEAKATPPPPPVKKREYKFNLETIAAQIDKRDPSRQAIAGETLNSNAALGLAKGTATSNVATWQGAFVDAVRRCFNFPYNGQDADQFEADIDIQMRPDGTLASEPVIVAVRGPSKSIATAMAENAKRAIIECQTYAFLPKQQYDSWKKIPMVFGLKDFL
jgi:outer membrane biosynthesis protein TonB